MDDSDLERLRRDTNQRTSMAKTLVGATGLGCFAPAQDDFNEDECESFNMTVLILHSKLSLLVLIPLHAKLLFLPVTLQHVGIWSTNIPYLDVRNSTAGRDKSV